MAGNEEGRGRGELSGCGSLQVGYIGGGLGSGEDLCSGELLFGFGLAAEAMVEPAKEEGGSLGIGSKVGAEQHLVGGLLIAAEFFQAKSELLMGEGVASGELHGGFEGIEGFYGTVLLQEKDAEVEEGLRVLVQERRLRGDGLAVGGDRLSRLAEALEG